jgi:outer membrane protein
MTHPAHLCAPRSTGMLARAAAAAALTATALAGNAWAQATPVWSVKAGFTQYSPHSQSNGITGIGVPPGADAKVNDASTLIVAVGRALGPHLEVELVVGIPPRVSARATGSIAFLGDDVFSAKNFAPTLLFNYHFGQPGDRWRPFLGAGVNYTSFQSARSKLAPDVRLSDSLGLAVQGGITYRVNREVGLFASVARLDVRSDVVGVGSSVLQTSIDFRPRTYTLGVTYGF